MYKAQKVRLEKNKLVKVRSLKEGKPQIVCLVGTELIREGESTIINIYMCGKDNEERKRG